MRGTPPQFTLLGPLSVSRDGVPTPIGGQKPRALLAALLLEPNQVVSRDRLIDAIWGEAPPDTARNTLQVYVSQLRKLLPDGVLDTAPPGYRLVVDPETVDLFRFVRLCDAGRSKLADGDAAGAAETPRAALSLWRGAPPAGAPAPSAGPRRGVPPPPYPLLGRERELSALADLVRQDGTRLVTLTGIGGIGKTRLAFELVSRLAPEFPDGTGVALLATLEDPALVARTILESLELPEAGREPQEAVIRAVSGARLLLRID